MQKLYRCLGVAVTAACLGVSGAPTAAPAAEPPSLIVVVDGSGSMAGQLEGGGKQNNKIGLVREALRAELAKVGTQARVGLVAFGHRRRGCTDVEIVRSPEPVDLEPMMTRLGQVRPNRGKGPLTLALREAAKRLPQSSGPRSLLLIHDGADNCQVDVCAAAAEFGKAGITAHVVSIGATPEDLAKMACLPQATGGRHFIAQNAEQVASYVGEAMRLASNQSAVAGFSTTIVPPAPVPASGPPALHLRAVLPPNNEPLSVPLYWTVSAEDQPETALFRAWSANPVVPVAPGRYVVEARSGLATARDTVVVRENRPSAVALQLDAGTARVRAVAKGTGAPLPGAIFTISTGEEADSPPLAVFKAGEAAPLLQAGRYYVRADLGRFRSKPQVLDVRAGAPAAIDIPLEAGRLQLTAEARDGIAPLEAPVFIVTEDDPPHGKREVARSAARQAEFVLPPNIYYVIARQGGVVARERVEIGSGDSVKVKLPLRRGRRPPRAFEHRRRSARGRRRTRLLLHQAPRRDSGGDRHGPSGAGPGPAQRTLSHRGPVRPDQRAHGARDRSRGGPDPAGLARASDRGLAAPARRGGGSGRSGGRCTTRIGGSCGPAPSPKPSRRCRRGAIWSP